MSEDVRKRRIEAAEAFRWEGAVISGPVGKYGREALKRTDGVLVEESTRIWWCQHGFDGGPSMGTFGGHGDCSELAFPCSDECGWRLLVDLRHLFGGDDEGVSE